MTYIASEFPGVAVSTLYGTQDISVNGCTHRSSDGHLCVATRLRIATVATPVLCESFDDGATWIANSIPTTGLHVGFSTAGTPIAVAEKPDGTILLVSWGSRTVSGTSRFFILYNERDPGGSWGSWVNVTDVLGTPSPYEGTRYAALIDDDYNVYVATSYDTTSLVTNETGSWVRTQITPATAYSTRAVAAQGGLVKFLDGTLLFSFVGGTSSTSTRARTTRRDPSTLAWDSIVTITGSSYGTASDLCVDIHRGTCGERLFLMVRGQTSAGMTRGSYVFVSDDKGLTGTQGIATTGNFTKSTIACSRYYLQLIGQPSGWPLTPYYYIVDEDRAKVATAARSGGPDDSCFDSVTFRNYTMGGRTDSYARWRAVVVSIYQAEHFPAGYGLYFSSGEPDEPQLPETLCDITQFILEVDVDAVGASQISQFLLEMEVDHLFKPVDISQFLIEIDDTGIDAATTQDDFSLAAHVTGPVTTQDDFALASRVKPVAKHGGVFELASYVYADTNQFSLQAKVKKAAPLLTDYYEDFDGPYEVRLLDHDGTLVRILERFEHLEFVRAVNGRFHNGYGSFQYIAASDITQVEEFTLDRILQVRRLSSTGPVVVFEGLVRYTNNAVDEGSKRTFTCAGPDLRHLMKRRIIIPSVGEAFASFNHPFTDTMRYLVYQNASMFALAERQMYRVQPYIFDSYGIPLNLHYRYTRLSDELDQLANVEEGADWEVVQHGVDAIYFKVHYRYKGKDRRRNGVQGWPEMIWSIDRANVLHPSYVEDRIDEVTVTIVGGEGIGVDREIEVRNNIADRQYDSPWNRVEEFIDASSETSQASLMAQGDANNVEHGMVRTFAVQSTQSQLLTYGKKWNLGDICTGEFAYGGVFDMRIVEVREVLDPRENHLAVYPTFFVFPRLEDY